LRQLADDIRVHGLREPVWLHPDGRIVDGRNRWRACLLASVEPTTRVYQGAEEELLPFLISLNMARRHMDESQRSMVAAKIARLPLGANQHGTASDEGVSIDTPSLGDAAELMNVSRSAGPAGPASFRQLGGTRCSSPAWGGLRVYNCRHGPGSAHRARVGRTLRDQQRYEPGRQICSLAGLHPRRHGDR
jgi:ParB-like nuclease family protein